MHLHGCAGCEWLFDVRKGNTKIMSVASLFPPPFSPFSSPLSFVCLNVVSVKLPKFSGATFSKIQLDILYAKQSYLLIAGCTIISCYVHELP